MYATVSTADESATKAAKMRVKRLNKSKNNWIAGIAMDLIVGAGPWVAGAVVLCAILVSLYDNIEGAHSTFELFKSPVAITAISTFASFLLVSKQGANLANNAKIVGEFGNMSGSLINIALFLKTQISSGKTIEFITLADGTGGFFQTTRIALVCASIMYVVKYTGRGAKIIPHGLPLGQDSRLLNAYIALVSPSNGSPGMSPFSACVLLVGELLDDFQVGEKASEYAVLFGQLNAVTAAEGSIGGTTGYSQPYLMKYLLGILYSVYLFLVVATDLVPNNGWNSLWIAASVAFCTISFYQISDRYGNPMKLRSSMSGQKPMISLACVDTEVAITSIFARSQSTILFNNGGDGSTSALLSNNVRFTLKR